MNRRDVEEFISKIDGYSLRIEPILDGMTIQNAQFLIEKSRKNEIISNITVEECRLLTYRLDDTEFTMCKFKKCIFGGPVQTLEYSGDFGMHRMKFRNCEFTDVVFPRNFFEHCTFIGCKFSRVVFPYGLTVNGCRFINVTGFPTCFGLAFANFQDNQHGKITDHNFDFERLVLDVSTELTSWERIRTFGNLPLFGLSFSSVIIIPIMVYIIGLYNMQISRFHAAIRDRQADFPWLGLLEPISPPTLTLYALLGTFLLAVGSTIFSIFCPPRVKEFSFQKWTDELRRPAAHYLAYSWKDPIIRLICIICYVWGAIVTGSIIVIKAYEAATMLWFFAPAS